jgi:hypothetical protein
MIILSNHLHTWVIGKKKLKLLPLYNPDEYFPEDIRITEEVE